MMLLWCIAPASFVVVASTPILYSAACQKWLIVVFYCWCGLLVLAVILCDFAEFRGGRIISQVMAIVMSHSMASIETW